VSKMRFLRRIEGVTLFNKVRSSKIRKSLNIEPLLLWIERSRLRWFGHVSRMPQERLPKQALLAKIKEKRPVGRPRTRWADHIKDLGWNRLGLQPSEMLAAVADHDVWRLNLELQLSPQPSRTWAGFERRRRKSTSDQICFFQLLNVFHKLYKMKMPLKTFCWLFSNLAIHWLNFFFTLSNNFVYIW